MKVTAPKNYHWMKSKKGFKLMKDPKDGFKPHKGASKTANFPIQKTHKKYLWLHIFIYLMSY